MPATTANNPINVSLLEKLMSNKGMRPVAISHTLNSNLPSSSNNLFAASPSPVKDPQQ